MSVSPKSNVDAGPAQPSDGHVIVIDDSESASDSELLPNLGPHDGGEQRSGTREPDTRPAARPKNIDELQLDQPSTAVGEDRAKESAQCGIATSSWDASATAAPEEDQRPATTTNSSIGKTLPRQKQRKSTGTKPTRIPEACALGKLRNRKLSERVKRLGQTAKLQREKTLRPLRVTAAGAVPSSSKLEPDSPATPNHSGEAAMAKNRTRDTATDAGPSCHPRGSKKQRTLKLWAHVAKKRRSSLSVCEIPVTQGFHIRNLSRQDFEAATKPHDKCFAIDGSWEPFDLPEDEAP